MNNNVFSYIAMKKFFLLIGILFGLFSSGCDDGGGGTSGGSGVFEGDCWGIAGDYNIPAQALGGKKPEYVAITIENYCRFDSRSASTGKSYGTLSKVADDVYMGTGTTSACPSGQLSVRVRGTPFIGVTDFLAGCI